MATQWGQTNLRHTDINVQREFERKSSPVIQSKTQATVSGSNPTTGGIAQPSGNHYTVYHNGTPITDIGKNISTNYIDGIVIEGDQYDVVFETFATGSDAHVKGFIKIPKTQLSDRMFYSEEFYTDKYFSNEPHALYSDLTTNYIKFGTVVYHDVKHNFELDNKYEIIWSITYIGDTSYRAIPLVVPIDGNTVRVYSSVRYELSNIWEYKNTRLMILPEEEAISKESLPKFFITLYSKNIIKFVLHGGHADTVIYNSIVHGGYPDTVIYNSIINGGKP